MRKLTSFLSVSALFLATQISMAYEIPGCPALEDIRKVGIVNVDEQSLNSYFTYSLSHFNTPMAWGFAVGPIPATSKEQAFVLANQIVSLMKSEGVPHDDGEFRCEYTTGVPNVFAIAMIDYDNNQQHLRQFMSQ